MSKISEQKALKAYPTPLDNSPFVSKGFIDEKRREGYIVGYNQAVQDLMEKAIRFLDKETVLADCKIEQFKNYMKDESEN